MKFFNTASRLDTKYNPGRSCEIDFLRGLALIFIVLDHMSVSVLSIFTIQHYSLFDATELFVFLSGYCIALAYSKIALKKGELQAKLRFLWRGFELYRAFLFTVACMLIIGYVCMRFHLDRTVVATTQIKTFLSHPVHYVLDVLALINQPYFSSILPMYVVFCLACVMVIPLLSAYPIYVLLVSIIVWLASASILPHTVWSFDPLAWQFIFLLGLFFYLFPFIDTINTKWRRILLFLAIILAVAAGSFKIIDHYQFPGYDKLHLAPVRIISFMSIAWIAYYYKNGVRFISQKLHWLQLIGQQSLPCFIGTTVISLVVNTLCEHLPFPAVAQGLIADALAIVSLFLVAVLAREWKKRPKQS